MADQLKRTIVKTIGWRGIAFASTTTFAYIYTGDISTSLQLSSYDMIAKTILYFGWERIWNLTKWGQETIDNENNKDSEIEMEQQV